jgi:DNA-binding LacI/PurR family transcriptional regulator
MARCQAVFFSTLLARIRGPHHLSSDNFGDAGGARAKQSNCFGIMPDSIRRAARRPTLEDVAKALGVSHQTVSRVINSHPRVLPKTRARVLAGIERLGYQPNRAARFLANQSSTLVGLVASDSRSYGPARALLSIQLEAQRHGYTMMTIGLSKCTISEVKRAAQELMANAAQGVIIDLPFEINRRELHTALADIPFVGLDVDGGSVFPSFAFDHVSGARSATQHLIDLGHRKIAGLVGEPPWRSYKLRKQGWVHTLTRFRLKPGPCLQTSWTAEGGYEATRRLIQRSSRRFSAIFAANDLIALGSMLALHERGIRVPEDVSVVGFDGMPEAQFFYPSLSTVIIDFDVLAKESLQSLFAAIQGSNREPIKKVGIPKLIQRKSTGPPPK